MSMYSRILVPIDGSATSTRGLDEAIALAKLTGATLRLLHVIDDLVFVSSFEAHATYAKDILPKLRRGGEIVVAAGHDRAAAAGISFDTLLVECFARRTGDVIVEHAKEWDADLIVLGTHGRRGIGRLLMGSDAEEIVRSAPVPVLLVRTPRGADDAKTRAPAAAQVIKESPQATTTLQD